MSDTDRPTRSSTMQVRWESGGTPIADAFDDPYYSRVDGRAETRHVFLDLNGLPARWATQAQFLIAELGFGTGLNVFETLSAWRAAAKPADARLHIVSFEGFPLTAPDLERAISHWPELLPDCAKLLSYWPPATPVVEINFGNALLELRMGDVNLTVPAWQGEADAWFLDGFSPARNPDMWGEGLMHAVGTRTAKGGTFATFTAAGWVRRNLENGGFDVQKAPGFGRKRDCLCGMKR